MAGSSGTSGAVHVQLQPLATSERSAASTSPTRDARAPERSGSPPGRGCSAPGRGRSRPSTLARWLMLRLPSGCAVAAGAIATRRQLPASVAARVAVRPEPAGRPWHRCALSHARGPDAEGKTAPAPTSIAADTQTARKRVLVLRCRQGPPPGRVWVSPGRRPLLLVESRAEPAACANAARACRPCPAPRGRPRCRPSGTCPARARPSPPTPRGRRRTSGVPPSSVSPSKHLEVVRQRAAVVERDLHHAGLAAALVDHASRGRSSTRPPPRAARARREG